MSMLPLNAQQPGPDFQLTDEHLELARHMIVAWQGDSPPRGAPGVCPKRPYGNGDAPADIIKLLGWRHEPGKDDMLRDRATELHAEMLHALQIILRFPGQVSPGLYRRRCYFDQRTWERIGD